MLESLRTSLSEIVFSCRVLSQAREATVAEVDGFVDGPIATALAEARAEGRRQGLEEAAKVVDARRAGYAALSVRGENSTPAFECRTLAHRIRSLATNTPETQKPETGESRLHLLAEKLLTADQGARTAEKSHQRALRAINDETDPLAIPGLCEARRGAEGALSRARSWQSVVEQEALRFVRAATTPALATPPETTRQGEG